MKYSAVGCAPRTKLSMLPHMPMIKITLKIDEATWNELKLVAKESHQNISGLLTEAVNDYLKRRRIRPEVSQHLADSIYENEELGRRLAQ
jgi:hypothetical protein